MVEEFERYGLPDEMRILTGVLQMAGALSLFIGFFIPLLGLFTAGGLTLMMLVAFVVRLKIKDPFIESFPSLFFMILNGYICFVFLQL